MNESQVKRTGRMAAVLFGCGWLMILGLLAWVHWAICAAVGALTLLWCGLKLFEIVDRERQKEHDAK